ncbi:unnamed protein product, partial [marine sediment metagenome]
MAISMSVLLLTVRAPLTRPTPVTPPTIACDVET